MNGYLDKGAAVVVTEAGDDYGRPGVVKGRVNDLAWVEFGCGRDEFYHVTKLVERAKFRWGM